MAEDEGFIERWSRRKTDAKVGDGAPPALDSAPEGGGVTAPEGESEAGKSPAIDPKDLPDIDSLDAESDFTIFMREGVPDHIRNLAMRKLWRLDPVLANLDGLLDYDEDFSVSERALEAVKTVYKVGKGMVGDEEPVEDADGEAAEPQVASDAQTGESGEDVVEAGEPEEGLESTKGDG